MLARLIAGQLRETVLTRQRGLAKYESLMEELEDLEDLRREKAKAENGVPFAEVLKEYELMHHVHLPR